MRELDTGVRSERMEALTEWVDSFWSCKGGEPIASRKLPGLELDGVNAAGVLEKFDKNNELTGTEQSVMNDLLTGQCGPSARLVAGRAQYVKLDATPGALLFLSCLGTTPGVWVMWLYALKHVQAACGEKLTARGLYNELKDGYPSDTELERPWDEQKVKDTSSHCYSNLLDVVRQNDFILSVEEAMG